MSKWRDSKYFVDFLLNMWHLADDGPEMDVDEAISVTHINDDVTSDDVTRLRSQVGGKMVDEITCQLEPRDLWDKFHALGTEMIITKSGRFVNNYLLYS